MQREIVKDFYWSLTFCDDFDSDPQDEGAEKNDLGAQMSVGWSL